MVALPTPPDGLVASVEEVATRLHLEPTTLPAVDRAYIEAALWDAQADLEGAVGRPLIPVQDTATGVWPTLGYDPADPRAWMHVTRWDDVIDVVSTVDNLDGTYDVTVNVGIDARAIPELRRWVVAAAVDAVRSDPAAEHLAKRQAMSVTADGQSVSYVKARGSGGQQDASPGGSSGLEGIRRRWRRPLVRTQPPPTSSAPWPYMGGDVRIWRY